MIRSFLNRSRLLTACAVLLFFAVVILARVLIDSPTPRSLPLQTSPPPLFRLASLRQVEQPSLDGAVGWINSGPITLAQLRGKIVLLDFWTYCCINCHHVLPTLAKLEAKYKNELVIIGVHSGKFDAERNTENIRRKVAEYRIRHPVANDANMVIWERFGVTSWPTLVLITPDGRYGGSRGGEVPFQDLDRVIGQVAARYKGQMNLKPIEFPAEADRIVQEPLLFPGKVLADPAGKRLFISDTGHNRVVVTDLEGKSPTVIGSGGAGLVDGDFQKAQFNRQQGLCLVGETLYVADTENHAIRAVDMKNRRMRTISGNGAQSPRSPLERYVGNAATSGLSSPWDIIQLPGDHALHIAMAGPHQIWKLNLKTGKIATWAGSGYEDIEDGNLEFSKFAQPSGLATDGKHLFVADSEASGVRVISGIHTEQPTVGRIVGQGLFKFGDVDGVGAEVRLQHCLGLAYAPGKLFIADTYNNKVKVCDLDTSAVRTFVGDGKSGSSDDPARLYQPGGLSVAGERLYVADTNNHKIRVVDITTKTVKTLDLSALSAPATVEKLSVSGPR